MIKIRIFEQIEGLPTIKIYNDANEELPITYEEVEELQRSIIFEIPELFYKKVTGK